MSELRKRGLVTAVIVSDPFIKLGTTQSKVFGTPELPLVKIQHPLGGLSLEQVEGRALVAVEQVVRLIKEHVK
jgi:hypothetical protein